MIKERPPFASLFLSLIDSSLSKIELVMLWGAGISLFVTMIVVFLDGTLRYALNSPLSFTTELVTLYLISCASLLGISYTLRKNGHVGVELFADMLPERLHRLLLGSALIAALAVVATMSYEIVVSAWDSWRLNELAVGRHAWPLWLGKAIVGFCFVALSIRIFHIGASNLLAGLMGNADFVAAKFGQGDETLKQEPV